MKYIFLLLLCLITASSCKRSVSNKEPISQEQQPIEVESSIVSTTERNRESATWVNKRLLKAMEGRGDKLLDALQSEQEAWLNVCGQLTLLLQDKVIEFEDDTLSGAVLLNKFRYNLLYNDFAALQNREERKYTQYDWVTSSDFRNVLQEKSDVLYSALDAWFTKREQVADGCEISVGNAYRRVTQKAKYYLFRFLSTGMNRWEENNKCYYTVLLDEKVERPDQCPYIYNNGKYYRTLGMWEEYSEDVLREQQKLKKMCSNARVVALRNGKVLPLPVNLLRDVRGFYSEDYEELVSDSLLIVALGKEIAKQRDLPTYFNYLYECGYEVWQWDEEKHYAVPREHIESLQAYRDKRIEVFPRETVSTYLEDMSECIWYYENHIVADKVENLLYVYSYIALLQNILPEFQMRQEGDRYSFRTPPSY